MPLPHPPPPDYGIDAPGVRRGMAAAGAGGVVLAGVAMSVAARASGISATAAVLVAVAAALAAVYSLGMAGYMTYASRVGKRRTRERLLDAAQALTPWTGHETVLDVGCGRGLMLVGAARRLTIGTAVGVDLWRAEDQTGNRPDAALENARREGVADRVRVETGDMRALPFADASFDAVLSHWVVHNLPDAVDRARALDEMLRVLRPGGTLVLADIANHEEYRDRLAARGLTATTMDDGGAAARIMGVLSAGSFRPQALLGRHAR